VAGPPPAVKTRKLVSRPSCSWKSGRGEALGQGRDGRCVKDGGEEEVGALTVEEEVEHTPNRIGD